MAEETKTPEQLAAETGTAGADAQKNNTSNGSQADKTEKTGEPNESAAQKRIRELVAKSRGLEAELAAYKGEVENKQVIADGQNQSSDEIRILRLEMRLPEHLKSQVDQISAFAKKHPSLSETEVISFFDKSVASSEANRADQAANQSRTGGNSNSAARNASEDIKSLKDDELKAELIKRMASGEKI